MKSMLIKILFGVATSFFGGITGTFIYKSYRYAKADNDGSAYKNYEERVIINTISDTLKKPGE